MSLVKDAFVLSKKGFRKSEIEEESSELFRKTSIFFKKKITSSTFFLISTFNLDATTVVVDNLAFNGTFDLSITANFYESSFDSESKILSNSIICYLKNL